MKRLLVLVSLVLLAGSVNAGSFHGEDPHKGLMGKGCDSKEKVAKLKEMFGDDYMAQHPHPGHFNLDDAKKALKEQRAKQLLKESI